MSSDSVDQSSATSPPPSTETEEADPLDVDYYGARIWPTTSQANKPSDDDALHVWHASRQEFVRVDPVAVVANSPELRRYQEVARRRIFKAEQLQTTVTQERNKRPVVRNVGPSQRGLDKTAIRAFEKLEAIKLAAGNYITPTVNPFKVYRESLARLNADGELYVRLFRCRGSTSPLELGVFRLRQAPCYAAVSYSWGAAIPNSQLDRLPVTEDLKAALMAMSGNAICEWLWIDAICINQHHPAEKSDQVSKMQQIYQRAEAVLIWLGNIEATDAAAADLTPDDRMRKRFVELLHHGNNAWWARLWVHQELVSAKRAFVFVDTQMSAWGDFVNTVSRMEVHDVMIAAEAIRRQSSIQEYGGRLVHAQHRIRQLYELRKLLRSSPGGEDILDLLRMTSHAHTSNLKDKVYGVLGLATIRDQRGIKVNYEKTVATVYADVVLHMAQNRFTLDVLVDQWHRRYGAPYDSDEDHPLPSWVPDFAIPMSTELTPLTRLHSFHASGQKPASVRTRDPLELKVLGVAIDTIDHIMDDCIAQSDDVDELDAFRLITLPTLQAFVEPALRQKLTKAHPFADLDRSDSLWRSLVADHGEDRNIPAPDTFGHVLDILEATGSEDRATVIQALGEHRLAALDMVEQIKQTMRNRVLFTTNDGLVGIAPRRVEKGDLIIVAFGASVPFAIRATSTKEKYALVDDCYVHGIMYVDCHQIVTILLFSN